MKDLAIYCAGGFGREVYCLIFKGKMQHNWHFVGFFDDGQWIQYKKEHNESCYKQLQYGPLLGGMKELNSWSTPLDVVIANGSPKWLKIISNKIINSKIHFPNIFDSDTIFFDKSTLKIGKGNIIGYNSLISCNVEIGDFNVFNGRISIGHETKIGNYNAFMPSVKISGAVTIGNSCLFGGNSFVIQGLKVKDNVTLSPCSALLTKTKEGKTYIGNPAELVEL